MRSVNSDLVTKILTYSTKQGATLQTITNNTFNGRKIIIENKEKINFTLCDYMGLSTDKRIISAAIEATQKFGAFTSAPRVFFKLHIYDAAEELLKKIFGKPCILIPRTTLAHTAVLPVIIDKKDAIILDHLVHTSVRNAVEILIGRGVYTETIRHNNTQKLEEKINILKRKYRNIWYMADGVYSMYGDTAPVNKLTSLLNKYDQFHVYYDDAHGMSWSGKNGSGYVLAKSDYHDRMFMSTSFAKGFGTGGSAIICPDEKIKLKILKNGAPLLFSGPLVPSTLGAIVASSEIHLSDEINLKQKSLQSKIDLFNRLTDRYNIPIITKTNTPIFFIPAGIPDTSIDIMHDMQQRGFFITGGFYPAVPLNNSGLRAAITDYHTEEDIEELAINLKQAYYNKLENMNISLKEMLSRYEKVVHEESNFA